MNSTAEHNHQHDLRDTDEMFLDTLQKMSYSFFTKYINRENGLVLDSTQPDSPCSISAVGFALSCYPLAIEHGLIKRPDALALTLKTLRFFYDADQSGGIDGTGYKGFFYHFLDPVTGKRAWSSELSTIDTALLIAGMMVTAQYFDGENEEEQEIRELTTAIYARIDWRWAQNGQKAIVLSWKPETGFNRIYWLGYNEAMILYVLALGAPTFPIGPDAYVAWTSTFSWRRLYGHDVLYARPLFIHQFSHVWLDLRGIQDDFMASRKTDYFENSRRATYIQQRYAIRNPRKFVGYHEYCWGFTASNGPGPQVIGSKHNKRRFYGYMARGVPFGPDDGTVTPWAAIASLPFAPDIVIPTARYFEKLIGLYPDSMGLPGSFNQTYHGSEHTTGWISPWHYALNHGPAVLMIENYRSGLIWRLLRDCSPIRLGLQRCGFRGGWLSED